MLLPPSPFRLPVVRGKGAQTPQGREGHDGLLVPLTSFCHSPSWICTVPSSVSAVFCCLFVKGQRVRIREEVHGKLTGSGTHGPKLTGIPNRHEARLEFAVSYVQTLSWH